MNVNNTPNSQRQIQWDCCKMLPFHRIIEFFGLEGTFRGHLAQAPAVSRDIFN